MVQAAEQTSALNVLYQYFNGYRGARVIHTATLLGLPDLLAAGPRTASELATETDTHAPSLARLLRALAALGMLADEGEGRFSLTSLGAALRRDAPGAMREFVLFFFGEEIWRSWGELPYSVRTGEPSFDRLYGSDNFTYYHTHPEVGEHHDRAFLALSARSTAAVLAASDFSRFGTLVDVGGSTGPLLAAILARNPRMRGILFDLPHVVAGAGPVLGEAGVTERCTVTAGDCFVSVPQGGDAYLLKQVIHDWDDERAVAILTTCRAAMDKDAVLLLVETVLPEQIKQGAAVQGMALLDLQMLVQTPGGRERTTSQFRDLVEKAGFTLSGITPTASMLSVVEAVAI